MFGEFCFGLFFKHGPFKSMHSAIMSFSGHSRVHVYVNYESKLTIRCRINHENGPNKKVLTSNLRIHLSFIHRTPFLHACQNAVETKHLHRFTAYVSKHMHLLFPIAKTREQQFNFSATSWCF